MSSRSNSVIGAIGRFLIGGGLIVLAFAAYQLWGTGLQEDRAQSELESEFTARQAAVEALSETTGMTLASAFDDASPDEPDEEPSVDASTTSSTLPIELAPELAEELIPSRGEALGEIRIPSIGVVKTVVEGTARDDLRKGPGHYPDTPFPGQTGNAAIAGHRTTYGAPFYDLDLVSPGDMIEVETLQGVFYYEVIGQPGPDGNEIGYRIVADDATEVVTDQGDDRLTLTACHPKYSAAQRIIVSAKMVGAPAPTLVAVDVDPPSDNLGPDEEPEEPEEVVVDEADLTQAVADTEGLDESLGWHTEELPGALTWAAVCLALLAVGGVLARKWRKWPSYVLVTPFFLAALWTTFGFVDRLLPAI